MFEELIKTLRALKSKSPDVTAILPGAKILGNLKRLKSFGECRSHNVAWQYEVDHPMLGHVMWNVGIGSDFELAYGDFRDIPVKVIDVSDEVGLPECKWANPHKISGNIASSVNKALGFVPAKAAKEKAAVGIKG